MRVKIAVIAGRVMLAALFVFAGVSKLLRLGDIQEYIVGSSVLPAFLALPTALLEIFGGLALAFGLWPRIIAPVMTVFTLLTIVFFHNNLADAQQLGLATKNLAIAGGLLMVYAQAETTR